MTKIMSVSMAHSGKDIPRGFVGGVGGVIVGGVVTVVGCGVVVVGVVGGRVALF